MRQSIKSEIEQAIGRGDVKGVLALLDHDVPVNQRLASGSTLLLLALDLGQPAVVEALLLRGADPNESGYAGITPLQAAVDTAMEEAKLAFDSGRPDVPPSTEMVALLLRFGADPQREDNQGQSAIDWARETGHDAATALFRKPMGGDYRS